MPNDTSPRLSGAFFMGKCRGYACWLTLLVLLASGWLLKSCRPLAKPAEASWQGVSVLYLLPASDADMATMRFLQQSLCDSLRVPVQVLAPMQLPTWAWYAPRKRYWADSLLKWMQPMAAEATSRWLLVTSADISTTRKTHFNWGVMGLAYQPGRVAVISDYRLQEHKRSTLAIQTALLKVALHELGHTSGLPHCPHPTCLMQDADGRDKTGRLKAFCNACRMRLFKP